MPNAPPITAIHVAETRSQVLKQRTHNLLLDLERHQPHAAAFLMESLSNIHDQLRQAGCTLEHLPRLQRELEVLALTPMHLDFPKSA